MATLKSKVVGLPTAAPCPVAQQPRRGRLPKAIASLAEVRYQRHRLAEEKKQQDRQRGFDEARKEIQDQRDMLTRALTEMLARTASGELRSFVYAVQIRGRKLATGSFGDADGPQALAMASRLQHRLAAILDEDEEE
jgi:hypothetical protein